MHPDVTAHHCAVVSLVSSAAQRTDDGYNRRAVHSQWKSLSYVYAVLVHC